MKQEQTYVCNNMAEFKSATNNLSVASEVPLQLIDNGVVKDIDNFKGVYNNTKGLFCCAVTKHYNVIQHKNYILGFGEALNRLNIKFKASITEEGNKVTADFVFEGRNLKFAKLNEEFATGVRLMNSYNKTVGIHLVPRYTRLACTNGMVLTKDGSLFSIRHVNKMAQEIESFIERKLAVIINQDNELQKWVSESMKDSIEWLACCRILEHLFERKKHLEEILKRLGISLIENKDEKTKKITYTYVWDDNTKKQNKLDRWTVYNSVTHFISHGEHITPNLDNWLQQKAEKLLFTPFSKLEQAEILVQTK